jgi:single-strand DNA-binding protein
MVLGNVGQDPEVRVTQSGISVMNLSVAVNSSWLDKNRVRQEKVEWIRCTIWGRRAEGLAKFLRKGMQVYIEGSLQTTSWEDRDGIKRYKTEVVARNVILGGGAKARKPPNDPEHRRPSRRDHYEGGDDAGSDGYDNQDYGGGDDDIPF